MSAATPRFIFNIFLFLNFLNTSFYLSISMLLWAAMTTLVWFREVPVPTVPVPVPAVVIIVSSYLQGFERRRGDPLFIIRTELTS